MRAIAVSGSGASPRPRGSTPSPNHGSEPNSGFPASAGIDPRSPLFSDPITWLPRVRGDRPCTCSDGLLIYWASPRPRGSTLLSVSPGRGAGMAASPRRMPPKRLRHPIDPSPVRPDGITYGFPASAGIDLFRRSSLMACGVVWTDFIQQWTPKGCMDETRETPELLSLTTEIVVAYAGSHTLPATRRRARPSPRGRSSATSRQRSPSPSPLQRPSR